MKVALWGIAIVLGWSLPAAGQELPPPPPPPPGMSEPAPSSVPAPPDRPPLPAPATAALPPPALSPSEPAEPLPAPGARLPAGATSRALPREARPRFDDRPFVLHAQLGLGSITGYAGLLAGYNIQDRLELGLGAGVAASGGPTGAAYLHVRPLLWFAQKRRAVHALTVQVGYSVSNYAALQDGLLKDHGPDPTTYHLAPAHWLQYDFGWEMLTANGLDVRAAFGAAISTNADQVYCTRSTGNVACDKGVNALPTLAVSVGHGF